MPSGNTYSDEYLLERMHQHCVEEMLSVYTLHKPTWEIYRRRMAKDAEFAAKVEDCRAEADTKWEKLGLRAMWGKAPEGFNAGLYKHFTQNKRAFLPYEVLEQEERINALEEAINGTKV